MTAIAIINGRVIDPASGHDAVANLYIDEHGLVAGIGSAPTGYSAGQTLDASGRVVCPGLVDLRARLREPGEEYKATIESEVRAAVSAGITTLCCPPDTEPTIDTPAMAQMVQQRAWRYGLARVYPLGALTRELKGEQLSDMAALAEAGCAGFSNALAPVTDTLVMRRSMEYAASFGYTVFLHSEDPWLRGRGCVHEGEISTRLGLPGVPETAETVGVARDLALIEHTGVRAHIEHLSCARAVHMLAEARARGLSVSADVTACHLHLTEHDIGFFDTRCHLQPPLRSLEDRSALRQALADGVIEVVCSDHQPHEADAKLAPFSVSAPGASGLETLLALTLRLVDEEVLDLPRALALITSNPARVLGIDAGRLIPGGRADVCIYDPDAEWELNAAAMLSRGQNTPFDGWRLRGRVTHTLVGGRLVFDATA